MCLLSILVLLTTTTWVSAVQQSLTFYSEKGDKGEFISFHTNIPDLEPYVHSLLTINGSYQLVGWWTCMSGKNYTGETVFLFEGSESMLHGDNDQEDGWTSFLSCRHHGALDTDTMAISLYSELDFAGDELLVTGHSSLVHFQVRSFSTTGKSSWTFYEGTEFNENPACVPQRNQVEGRTGVTKPISFITRDCD